MLSKRFSMSRKVSKMFQDGMSESLEAAYMEPIKLGTLVKWEQETTENHFF